MKCLYNNEDFVQTRSSQKFANSKNRMKYHNEKRKQLTELRAFIDSRLHKNHNILMDLMKEKTTQIFHKEFLKGKGFSFNVLTHYQLYQNKNRHALYDFLILEQDGALKIVRYD